MPAVRLLQSLLAAILPAMVTADGPDMVRLLESVAKLLVRRSELERSYLARLEGELHRLQWHNAKLCSCYQHERSGQSQVVVAGLWPPQAVQGLWYHALGTTCQEQLQRLGLRPTRRLARHGVNWTRLVAGSKPVRS